MKTHVLDWSFELGLKLVTSKKKHFQEDHQTLT